MEGISEKDLVIGKAKYQSRKGSIEKCKDCSGLKCCGLAKRNGIIEPPYLTKFDIRQIEFYSGVKKEAFAVKRRNPITGHSFLVMWTESNGGCIFFNKNDGNCKIHSFRPMDCRLFPLDIEIRKGVFYWALYKFPRCELPKNDLLALLAYRDEALQILGEEIQDYASYPVPGMQKVGYKILMKIKTCKSIK